MSEFRAAGVSASARLHKLLVVRNCFGGVLGLFSGLTCSIKGIESIGVEFEFSVVFDQSLFGSLDFEKDVSNHLVRRNTPIGREDPLFLVRNLAQSLNGLIVPAFSMVNPGRNHTTIVVNRIDGHG